MAGNFKFISFKAFARDFKQMSFEGIKLCCECLEGGLDEFWYGFKTHDFTHTVFSVNFGKF